MINYAHRGASEYAPENTLSSFYSGLLQGADGIETDVQKTKDGVLVLFHDDTLDRVTDASGKIEDYTYIEISKIKVFGNATAGFYDKIPTLREFFEKFSSYNIHFAIELKVGDIEKDVINMISEFNVTDKTTVTSFDFEWLKNVKRYDTRVRVGLLTVGDGCDKTELLKSIGGEEMAPQAKCMTSESVKFLRKQGFGVRAWGVTSVELLKKMCDVEVDGMTVNFPDRLYSYLASKNI